MLAPRFLWALALIALSTTLGCVEAEQLPTQPLQANVKLETHVGDWRDEVIYQVLVDRFHDGDPNNNYNVDLRSPARYHGGDWQGLIDKLDYLQELGVTTVWISPVVKNVEEDAGYASYHGYWTQDFLKHNPHFGDLHELRRLSDELHKRDMKLILDIVTNHVGQVFFYDINMNGRPDEWLSGSGNPMQNGPIPEDRELSRITEYDPDWDPEGIRSFTSLGLAGDAPAVFFDMPEINRIATGPQNIDLDGDGAITTNEEQLGFANPSWYHMRGRVVDWDRQPPLDDYWNSEASQTPPYNHFYKGQYIDGEARNYYQNDQTLMGDFPGGLKDLRTSKPEVRTALIQAFTYWIDVTDADGFRIDTLKHVEYSFWEEFCSAMRSHAAARGKQNFFMFGEAFDGNDQLLGAYTAPNQVDSVFFFSQKYAIDNVFKCPPGNNADYCNGNRNGTADIYGWGGENPRLENFNTVPQPGGPTDDQGNGLAPSQLLVSFLDNHDVGRYLYDRQDGNGIASFKVALAYLLTTHGIPCIYYGSEQGFFGGNDPANREDMWDSAASWYATYNEGYAYSPWNTDNPLFLHIKSLIALRKQLAPLRRGDFNFIHFSTRSGDEDDAGILAFERTYNGETVVVVINTHESKSSRTRSPDTEGGEVMSTSFGAGTRVRDAFSNSDDRYTVSTGGQLDITLPAQSFMILVAE